MKRIVPVLLLLASCGQPLAPPAPGPATEFASHLASYRAAAASGAAVYAVDPGDSLIAVTVRRAGLMARLGHEHVVASHTLAGYAAPGLGRADLAFRLDALTIDEPHLLRDAGIATQPSPAAVAGTRSNMLGPVLDAERYPVVNLHVEWPGDGALQVAVTLHGITRRLDLPAAVQIDAATMIADGTARLKQTDFGIAPFSVGAGLLAVGDELEVRYRIVARRWKAPGHP